MIQGVDVGDYAVEQFPLAKARQPRRREGEQFAEGEDAQVLQHAEGGIVADQTLEIASGGTDNRCAADARGGQHIVKTVDPGDAHHRRGGEKPAGERQQADTGQQGHNSQYDAEQQHPFVAFIQCQIG